MVPCRNCPYTVVVAAYALVGWLLFAALAFGLRSLVHWWQTGTSGFLGISGRPGSVEWLGGVGFTVAALLGPLAPALVLVGASATWPALDVPPVHTLGIVLYGVGVVATLWAQLAMGRSWRVGVRDDERTALVTVGPFRWIRNPIYTAMLLAVVGLALMVPTVVSALAVVALLAALELHVRAVEEPYLTRVHGPAYRDWGRRTGRFLPGVGRLS